MLTTGDICLRLGALPWQLNRTIARGFLREPERLGCYRIFREEDVPRVRAALVEAGYLDREEVPA